MQRFDIINTLIKSYKLKSYLEIGLREGRCFAQVQCKTKESVDPAWKPTYKMTSDDFFKINKNTYDIIFIDGMHEANQVYRDIMNSLKVLNEGGFIVLHDCNPQTESDTRFERNGTVYKGFIKAKQHLDCNCFVVDTDHGCGVITNRELQRIYGAKQMQVDWYSFMLNRKELLSLISPNEFIMLLNH